MSFDSQGHPRATDGKFTDKVGAAPEVGLTVEREPVTASIRRNIFDIDGESGYFGYDESNAFDVEGVLDNWTLDEVKAMREDQSYARLYPEIARNGLVNDFFLHEYEGEVRLSDAVVDDYIAERASRETEPQPEEETRPSKSGSFGFVRNLSDLADAFEAHTSPENLYMDGELSERDANRRYKHLAAGYATRAAELATQNNYERAVSQAVAAISGFGDSTEAGRNTRLRHAEASGHGASASLFSGGSPTIEASGTDTVLISFDTTATVKVPKGSDPTIVIAQGARARIEFEEGAKGLVVSASSDTELRGTPETKFVGVAKAEPWPGYRQGDRGGAS
jgi:hypothetical protein